MQKVSINDIIQGAVVAKPIHHKDGVLLLSDGAILKEKGINKLKALGVDEAYVSYPVTETSKIIELYEQNPSLDDIICQKTRFKAQQLIAKTMNRVLPEKSIDIEKIFKIVDEIIAQLLSVKDIVLTLSRLRTIDGYTYEHCVNVCVVSLIIGMDLKLQQEELKMLGIGALLHDVGKAYISEEILNKPGALSCEEFDEVKAHTIIGYKILLQSGIPEESAQIALNHHEKYDGSGYMQGICAEDIPLMSRIVTIADAYDAMSNDRVYRSKLAPDKVYKEIARYSGIHFDSEIAERFLKRIGLYPIGTGVVLNTNHKGVVVAQNKFLPQSPVIRIYKDAVKYKLKEGDSNYVDIDLSKTKYLFITDTF